MSTEGRSTGSRDGPPVRSSISWVRSTLGSTTAPEVAAAVGRTTVGTALVGTPEVGTPVGSVVGSPVGWPVVGPPPGPAVGLGWVTLPGGRSPASEGSTSVGRTMSGRFTAGSAPVP